MMTKAPKAQRYEELNHNIEECEYEGQAAGEAWDCCVGDITLECLNDFTEADWEMLRRELPTKSAIWKRRLISCMIDTPDPEVNLRRIRALIDMADTDEEGVFADAVSALCDFDIAGVEGIQALIDRARTMTPCAEKYHQVRINIFMDKATRSGFHV
ncbi:MAG: hypothetical protein Q4C10_14755 [Clostridia bacterium]|nr:hypothetical protein [Clostridia bacterium]